MGKPRHAWTWVRGSQADVPSTLVERCAHCDVTKRDQRVTTSRVGLTPAPFFFRDAPQYSRDGRRWSFEKPVCTGKRPEVVSNG